MFTAYLKINWSIKAAKMQFNARHFLEGWVMPMSKVKLLCSMELFHILVG